MAEISRHKSRRGEDPGSDDVADKYASGGEPADAAGECGQISFGAADQDEQLLLVLRANQRDKPHEGESFSLIALCCPVIEIKRLDVSADRQDQPTTDG